MSSKEISIIAILYPKQGKTDQVIALLRDVSKYVEAEEPGVVRYEINRSLRPGKDGLEEIIMTERYRDQATIKEHGSSATFTAFQKTLAEKGLMRAPMLLRMVEKVGGFSSRL